MYVRWYVVGGGTTALFVLGTVLLIKLVFATIGIYFIAKWIAPLLGVNSNKAAIVALVASIANIVLWLALSVAIATS